MEQLLIEHEIVPKEAITARKAGANFAARVAQSRLPRCAASSSELAMAFCARASFCPLTNSARLTLFLTAWVDLSPPIASPIVGRFIQRSHCRLGSNFADAISACGSSRFRYLHWRIAF